MKVYKYVIALILVIVVVYTIALNWITTEDKLLYICKLNNNTFKVEIAESARYIKDYQVYYEGDTVRFAVSKVFIGNFLYSSKEISFEVKLPPKILYFKHDGQIDELAETKACQ